MRKSLLVAIFIIALATILPSFADNVSYDATVAGGQNTVIEASDGSFGTILVGDNKIINNSVTLNNTGDVNATVDARFNTSINGTYGLISGGNLLNASNFALLEYTVGNWTALSSTGEDVRVAIAPSSSITTLAARLSVPQWQLAGAYSGTVILTFGNEV